MKKLLSLTLVLVLLLSCLSGTVTANAAAPTITTCQWTVTIPANYKLLLSYSYSAAEGSYDKYYRANTCAYTICCDQKVVFADGTVKYHLTTGDGYSVYFKYTSGMSVTENHTYDNACDDTCNTCSSTRTVSHAYVAGYDTSHPHRQYMKCSPCGSVYFTGETKTLSSCSICVAGQQRHAFNTVDGSVAYNYSAEYDMTVTIFGKEQCSNSGAVLDHVISTGLNKQSNIRVLYVDFKQSTKSQVQSIADQYKNSSITFCYDTTTNANRIMWDYAHQAGFGNSISTPLVVFTKGDGTVFKITQGYLEADYLYQLANRDLSGEDIISLQISGEENYSYASDVLQSLNTLRRGLGLPELTLDKGLMTAAMQRAAELSVYYSHTRPNGESCFTVLSNTYGSHGENIAIGQTSPTVVMSSWTNSSGHYANMTNAAYSSVGIGCFKTSNGYLCWVQLFSSNAADSTTVSGKSTVKHTVEARVKNLSLSMLPEQTLHTLAKGKKTTINVWNTNNTFSPARQQILNTSFNYSSSNTNVLSVASDGSGTVKNTGTVSVTITPKTSTSFKLKESYRIGHVYSNACDKTCNSCGSTRTINHTYSSSCDSTCNVCKATRSITHTYARVVTKATLNSNGKIAYKCSGCGYVASKTTVINRPTSFKLSTTAYTYNGNVRTPSVTVKDAAGNTLVKNTDYTVTYASGRKNVGTYTVTVKMKGKYSGTKTLSFKIDPIDVSKCTVKLSASSYAYNGKVKTPTVTVKNANGTTLTKGTHYTVTYASGRKAVGKYKVTVKMKGNYSGTKTLYFTVKPKAASINSLSAKSKALTVNLNRVLSQSTGYQIQYSTSKSFSSAKTKTVSNYKTSSATLTGLKAETTYFVRVRTYKTVGSTKYYSNWSSVKYKKTK